MSINYNKHGPYRMPDHTVCRIRGAPGLLKCELPPGYKGWMNQHICASKPPGSVLKFLYLPRNGIAVCPPAESHTGGLRNIDLLTYDSITRGSPPSSEFLNGWIVPACYVIQKMTRLGELYPYPEN